VDGRKAVAKHVVVDDTGVFVAAEIGDSTSAYGLRLEDGTQMWSWDSRTDIHHGHWPTLAFGYVILNDDGLFVLDPRTGDKPFNKGVDWWGQTLTDGDKLYLVNSYHIHGPQAFVGALDRQMEPVWQENVHGTVAEDYLDRVGAIALDEGTIFQAVDFRWGGTRGLFAFDAGTGQERWYASTKPAGPISAYAGMVHGVEGGEPSSGLRLVARAQRDGEEIWAEKVEDSDLAAPAIADWRLLTFSPASGVVARDSSTGQVLWTREFPATAQPAVNHATHLAVAWLSRTVVVGAGGQMAILQLSDGRILWTGTAPGAGPEEVHSPVVAEENVYVVRSGSVFALACEG